MKIRARLVWLLFFVTLLSMGALIIQRNYENKRSILLFKSVQTERESTFDKILELKRTALYTFSFDYSFWDEMVEFVAKPDENWAHENIDAGRTTYKASAAWVYNADFRLVYSVSSPEAAGLKEIPIPPAAMRSVFANKPLCHFFANTSKGLMEIFGAYVQPSSDNERKTPALGYFFCGQLWDKSYIDDLSEVTGSTVVIVDSTESRLLTSGRNTISYSRALTGWDNKPLKYLVISVVSQAIEGTKRTAAQVSLLFICFVAITLLILYFFITFWISFPLKSISLSLEKGDSSPLKLIKKQRSEFGDISRLIGDFFSQREEILHEIIDRQKVEDRLGKALDEEIKSREIVTSMLDDNNQIREQLEHHIEELKRTQNMLVQSEKLASLGRLVSEIAHEVNNPLMIISGNAQLSLMAGPLSDEVKNNLEIITNECQRAKSIIQRLLKFSKPSKGETKQVDINKSIESVVGIMENQFKLVNVDIKREYREDLPHIFIDEQQMHEVFMNLINNAKDAMPDRGGTITITTSLEGDYLRIDFKDNGCGMPEEMKERFPEPFFTTKEKGTGLGLAVCYGIIKVHSGDIKLQSELNKGTVITVLLPW